MKIILITFLLCSSLLSQEEKPLFLIENPLEGKKILMNKGCINCHSVYGAGGKLAPDLSLKGKTYTFYELAGLFLSHSPQMVEALELRGYEWPIFTPEEMSQLFGYLYLLNYFEEPGEFHKGKIIFQNVCIKCHSLQGKGGKRGPPLDAYANYVSPIQIAVGLWNHGPKMARALKSEGLSIPFLTGEDIKDILAYIRGVSKKSESPWFITVGNPLLGEKLFQNKKCTLCHSVQGKGGKIASDIKKITSQNVSDIVALFWNHGMTMWKEMEKIGFPFPKFTQEEMSNIVAYLYFVKYFDEPGDPSKGEDIFVSKGCVNCHEKGKVGPELVGEVLKSPFHFASSTWNHIPLMKALSEQRGIPWPRFEGNQMRDLVAYLRKKYKDVSKK